MIYFDSCLFQIRLIWFFDFIKHQIVYLIFISVNVKPYLSADLFLTADSE